MGKKMVHIAIVHLYELLQVPSLANGRYPALSADFP